jgi:hypothetical protein
MKRILLAVILLTLTLLASRRAEAGIEVSVDFFYDNLGSDGSWVELGDYGYCWQPSVAVSNSNWRPYADGYWAYTDVGWTWVSNEDFGWATYHYGRWARLHDRGWFWVPGREWGPAWVSWRTGGDYVGWAPLPPRGGGEVVYDSSAITGQVDVEFDIGPAYYNFVDVRYIGEPLLRERIFEPSLNITYITQTVNVTNITYVNSTVYNYGPDYDRLSQYSTRPIRRMTLEHDANTDLSVAVTSNKLTRVQGDKLIVAAPLTIQKAPNPTAPKMVKEKIAKPTIEHGWSGVPDPKAQADLKQKMKSENPKNVPPPSVKAHDNPEAAQGPARISLAQDQDANKDTHTKEAPGIPHQPPPPNREAPPDSVAKRPLPPERVLPPKQDAPPDIRPKRAFPPERVAPPLPDTRLQRPLPPERVAPPKLEAPPDSPPKRPLPPERVAPPKLEAAPNSAPVRSMPPKREAPPEVPHRQPSTDRIAPPTGPAADGPLKGDAPASKRVPDKRTVGPSPAPGS